MLNILLVGLGSIAQKHVTALKNLNIPARFYALRHQKNAEQFLDVINIFEGEKLPDHLDFIMITNPTSLHLASLKKLMPLKIPFFIEKPAVHSLENTHEVVEYIKSQNIATYVAYNLRFHPCIVFLKKHLDAHPQTKINEVNIYCGSFLPDWRPHQKLSETYSAQKNLGGGVHLDLSHELDYAMWLFGFPTNHRAIVRKVSDLPIDAPDYAQYNLLYADFNVSIVLNYYRKDYKRQIEVVFDNDTWTVDLGNPTEIRNNKGEIIYKHEYTPLESYEKQLSYFLATLKEGKSFMNSLEESLKMMKVCLSYEEI